MSTYRDDRGIVRCGRCAEPLRTHAELCTDAPTADEWFDGIGPEDVDELHPLQPPPEAP